MTNEEINRYIHEQIMGKCWHKVREARSTIQETQGRICDKCHEGWLKYGENASKPPQNPNYCSDDSPRRLLNEVVATLVPMARAAKDNRQEMPIVSIFAAELHNSIDESRYSLQMDEVVTASAEQIARACVAAHRESKK